MAAALVLSLAGLPCGAQAMSVQDALTKTQALQKKGMLGAMFSPDYPAVKQDVLDAGKTWRAQVNTAKPPVCAPPKVNFSSDDAISFLKRVPEAQRATADAKAAIVDGLNDRYRCR